MVKVSIVIPVYKPEKEVFNKVKEMIKKQTINAEIVENWDMPEAKSMNTGIKKAKGGIIVTLAQDCVPEDEFWLEKLTIPLKDKKVVATVSNLYLTEEYWKTYPLLTRILTLNERNVQYPEMDARACAYRKKDLIKLGMFNEDPKVIGIDGDLYIKLKKIGKIARSGCKVFHLHPLTNSKKIKMIYNYAEGNGKIIRTYGLKDSAFWLRVLRATPFLGFVSILGRFPFKKYFSWLPIYLLIAVPINHLINVFGFWRGFFFSKRESSRNTEVLKEKKDST